MKTIGVIIISVFALLLVCSLANQAVVMKLPDSEVIGDKSSPVHFVRVIGQKVALPGPHHSTYPFVGLLAFGAVGITLVLLSRHHAKPVMSGPLH